MGSDGVDIGFVISAIIGGIVLAGIAWLYAPPVGGDAWPYIRVAVSVVAFAIGTRAGQVAFAALGLLAIGVSWLGITFIAWVTGDE